jgi:hypothetical protein
MISWHTTTGSCLSSHQHGIIHITSPLSLNWTTHRAPPPLKAPFLLILHLPLPRAPWMWNPTQSPDKPIPYTHHNHVMKRDPHTALPSESFGRSHSRGRSVTHHQHHAANHKYLSTMLRSRGDVSCLRRLRRKPLHKSMLRFYFTFSFSHSSCHFLITLSQAY